MKDANKDLSFEQVEMHVFEKYVEQAEFLHEKGLHTDKSILELSKLLYKKDIIK